MAAPQAVSSRPPLTGWLVKHKSEGSRSRMLKRSNRRFFTLDFDSQMFFYAHTEDNKTVSMPTHFRHMVGVEASSSTQADSAEDVIEEELQSMQRTPSKGSVCSKGSIGSVLRLSRLSSFTGILKRQAEQHGFILRMHDKSLDLLCESKAEADTWIAAIREAIASAKCSTHENVLDEALKPEPSTSPGSSRCTTPRTSSSGTSRQVSGQEASPIERSAVLTSAMKMFAQADMAVNLERSASSTFAPTPRSDSGKANAEVPLPPRSARSTASGEKRSPRQFAITSVLKHRPDDAVCGCWGGGGKAVPKREEQVAARYSDKAQGLSLNERLSQLEFSDDEDSDEGELRPATQDLPTQAQTGKAASPPPAADTVVVEACEEFVTPDSDSD